VRFIYRVRRTRPCCARIAALAHGDSPWVNRQNSRLRRAAPAHQLLPAVPVTPRTPTARAFQRAAFIYIRGCVGGLSRTILGRSPHCGTPLPPYRYYGFAGCGRAGGYVSGSMLRCVIACRARNARRTSPSAIYHHIGRLAHLGARASAPHLPVLARRSTPHALCARHTLKTRLATPRAPPSPRASRHLTPPSPCPPHTTPRAALLHLMPTRSLSD